MSEFEAARLMLDPLFTQDGPFIEEVDSYINADIACKVIVGCREHGEQWCGFDYNGHYGRHVCGGCYSYGD